MLCSGIQDIIGVYIMLSGKCLMLIVGPVSFVFESLVMLRKRSSADVFLMVIMRRRKTINAVPDESVRGQSNCFRATKWSGVETEVLAEDGDDIQAHCLLCAPYPVGSDSHKSLSVYRTSL